MLSAIYQPQSQISHLGRQPQVDSARFAIQLVSQLGYTTLQA